MLLETLVAVRGKGGMFQDLGIIPKGNATIAHGLGAFIVALGLGIYFYTIIMTPAFAAAWLLFTKPSPDWCFRVISRATAWSRLKAWPLAAVRQAYVAPLAITVYLFMNGLHFTTNAYWFLILLILPAPYYIGGILQRHGLVKDAVEFGDYNCWIIGVMLLGVGGRLV